MKIPKEKANELVEKCQNVNQPEGYDCIAESTAIQCAKIAVDEIIDQWFMIDTYLGDWNGQLNPNLKYWQEVKNELNKM